MLVWYGRAQYAETHKHAGRLIDAGLINFDMGEYNTQHAGRLVKYGRAGLSWFDMDKHAGRLIKFRNIGIENSNSKILELKRAQY